jgi:multiple sugar transport system permease protein
MSSSSRVARTQRPPQQTAAGTLPPRRRRRRLSRPWQGFAFALPTAIFVLVLFVVPILLVAQMSASEWGLLVGDQGINLPDNYRGLTTDPLFWPAVRFTLLYTVVVTVLLLGLGLAMALLVQEQRPGVGLFRTAYFLPSALGLASASLLFWGFYSPSIGPLNTVARTLNLIGPTETISWIGTPRMALFSTVMLIVWRFAGFYMIIMMVGLQAIPTDVYEAARVDGAGRFQIIRRITLPLLRPAIALSMILCVTGSLLAFDQFFILTKGGPDNSTVTVVQLIYREAFQRMNLGTAAALSVIVLVVLIVLNLVQFRVLRGKDRP